MPTLHIHLLGDFRLSWDEAPVRTITAPRLHALLVYLLLHHDAPQPHHHFAFLLWPETTEAQARTNLRQLLHSLKQALPAADHFVHTDAKTLQWHPEAPYRLDVAEFEQAYARAEAAAQQADLHALRVALEHASTLYQGDLLPSRYDDWILPERERLRQALTGALERLLRLLESAGEPRAALAYAQRLLRHDPLREGSYRTLMRLSAACGDRAGVLRVYHTCASVLERELATEPSAATRDAYAHALSVEVQAPPVLLPQPSHTNLPVPLTSFVGRERELAELARLLSSSRLLTLTGTGGTGKTRLALRLAAEVQEAFAAGVWLVELASLADPTLVTPTVAATLGVREQPGRPLLDALLDYVRTKRLQLLLRRLSVFAGGWTCEAAQAVCGERLGEEVLDPLVRLVDKSMVVVDEPLEAAEGRYRLLETIRQYARDRLFEAGEVEAVRKRHLEYFLRFAEEAEPKLRGAEQLAWLERVETEHDNLRLAGALTYFWELRGYWSEGPKWLNDALARSSREQGARAAAGKSPPPSRVEMAQRAKVLYRAGRLRFAALFDPSTSRMIVEESLRLWRELGDTWWRAVALEHVGFMLVVEGDIQMARVRLEEGIALARQVEDRWPLAMCLFRLAGSMRTDHAAARRIREEGVAVARRVGDKSVLSQGLIGLVTDQLLEGNVTAAAPVAGEALAEARAIGSATHITLSLLQLVIITCCQGDRAQAKGYCLQALALARETGSPQWLLLALFAFGVAACFSGQPRRGARLLVAAVTLLGQRGIDIRDESERDVMVLKQALERKGPAARPGSIRGGAGGGPADDAGAGTGVGDRKRQPGCAASRVRPRTECRVIFRFLWSRSCLFFCKADAHITRKLTLCSRCLC